MSHPEKKNFKPNTQNHEEKNRESDLLCNSRQ